MRTSFNEGGVLFSALSTNGRKLGVTTAIEIDAPYIIRLQTITGST